ncbi:hypothetical protein JCM14450A_27000 [Geobacillus stearothermophilus]
MLITHISHPLDENREDFFVPMSNESLRVRQFITPEHPLKGPGGRKLTRPTGQAIFQLFQYVNVVLFKLPDGRIQRSLDRSLTPDTPDQRRILQGLGMDESIYV